MQKETHETQNSLIYHSEYGGDSEIQLEVQQYANNGRIAISMLTNEEGYPEHYGSLTVNIDAPAPAYCGYLDTNNLSNAEKFVTENGLGEFTGLTGRSGFVYFPFICSMPRSLGSYVLNRWQLTSIASGRMQKKPEKKRADRRQKQW